MPTKPLSIPAPNRARVTTTRNRYITRPWTVEDVALAQSSGAFFIRGQHDFADRKASALALHEPEDSNV